MIFVSTKWYGSGDDFQGTKGFLVGFFRSSYLGIGLELQGLGVNAWKNDFVVFWNRWSTIDDMVGDQIINRLLIAHSDALSLYKGFRQKKLLSCLDFTRQSLLDLNYRLRELLYHLIKMREVLSDDIHDEE